MPRIKTIPPKPSRHKGQRSKDAPFLLRFAPPYFTYPDEWYKAEIWRSVVRSQPFAILCRETLISNMVSLDWKIEPRDSNQRDELKDQREYYTRFLEYTGDYEYTTVVEWIIGDYLDLPFGSGVELGYMNDDPDDDLAWIELLDGGTLSPYPNSDWPVMQRVQGIDTKPVFFPNYAINRMYMSPRREIVRKGWGLAPPEKIYLAVKMLERGDAYYASLMLDTPEAGILDLIDMEQESAEDWIERFRALMTGVDPFKIPVLYEHTEAAQYISFGKVPNDIMFDRVTLRYAALVAAGYGLSLSDIGLQVVSSGGETLAGSIRQERRTRKTGLALAKKKLKAFFDRMLPESLEFKFIDLDDELSVALGRARLASATAFGNLIDKQILTPDEARQQLVADGLISVSIPESVPDDAEWPMSAGGATGQRPGLLGTQVPPSSGGQGEVRQADHLRVAIDKAFNGSVGYLDIDDEIVFQDFKDVFSWMNEDVLKGILDRSIVELRFNYQKLLDSGARMTDNVKESLVDDFTDKLSEEIKHARNQNG